jgi:hypothetical protein
VTDAERLRQFYRRCRLEDQRRFYENRSGEFRSAASQLALVSGLVLLLTSAASFGAGVEWGGTTAFGIAAVALPALSTALAGYGALYAFEQQNKLYDDALSALRQSDAAAPGSVVEYAAVIEEILAREQAQWGQLVAEIKPVQTGS